MRSSPVAACRINISIDFYGFGTIGYIEIGAIGYYSQRRIIDPLGLVNPGVAPHVAANDLMWAYRHYKPDYIIQNVFVGNEILDPQIAQHYHEIMRFSNREQPHLRLIIYQRNRSEPQGG